MKQKNKIASRMTVMGVLATAAIQGAAFAQTDPAVMQELDALKQRVQELERESGSDESTSGIKIGGAVRFQYSYEDYSAGNRDRGGDFDFDTFRLNLDGSIGDVLLSAEYRWYQYMDVIHHAWVGYDFSDTTQAQLGIHQVPFGVLPYNSHSYFFSSNYYVGLEDDYDMGIKVIFDNAPWNLQLALYKNDEQGGVDGYVSDRSARYSYDPVGSRPAGEGIFAQPANAFGETNTVNARAAYTFARGEDRSLELGVSGQYGDLHDGAGSVGSNSAYAVHAVGNHGRWNVQLQATRYEYDLDSGAQQVAVGAYAFFDTIAARATTYTANAAYTLPVSLGPVSALTFYNNYSVITSKSASLEDTWMNVLGMAVSAGGVYAYFDYVMARNQPFIGGSMAGNAADTNSRFNINVGYYF
ncbi:MAG: hypothetical protein WDZ63_00820 [Burkholderiales bacterium]